MNEMNRRKYLFLIILVFCLMVILLLIPGLSFIVREISLVILALVQVFILRAGFRSGEIGTRTIWFIVFGSILLLLMIFSVAFFGDHITRNG